MGTHQRRQIRTKIKELLAADSNFTGVTIFSSRQNNVVLNQQLPSITVYVDNEPVTPESMNKRRYIRSPEIRFEVRVTATDDVDDQLDDLMASVENLMDDNSDLDGLLLESVLQNSELEFGLEATKEIGLGTVIYQGQYIT